jgi:4-amino-4-deoxy-L-arabinose transferase-like glycosyltransferase
VLGRWARPTFLRSLVVITAGALVWRLLFVLVFRADDVPMANDSFFYTRGANLLVSGHGFIQPHMLQISGVTEQAADHPPLYLLWLAVASLLDPGRNTSELVHMLWSCLPGAGAVALVGLAGRYVAGERAGLIAAGVAAVYPNMWMHDGMLLAETMSIFTVALVLLMTYRLLAAPSPARAAWLGVACGLAALTRSEMLLLAPLVLVPVVLLRREQPWRQRILTVTAGGVAALAVVAPWIAFNATRFEEPVYMSTNFAITLAAANCDSTYFGDRIAYKDWNCAVDASEAAAAEHPDWETFDASQRDNYVRPEVVEYVMDRKKQALYVAGLRVARVLKLYGVGQELEMDSGEHAQEDWAVYAGLATWYVIAPAAGAGAVVLWRRRRRDLLLPLVATPAVTLLGVAMLFGQTRYAAPMSPAVVVLAAVAIDAWLTRRSQSRDAAADEVRSEIERTREVDPVAAPV